VSNVKADKLANERKESLLIKLLAFPLLWAKKLSGSGVIYGRRTCAGGRPVRLVNISRCC
jgi:hypothetical protein